MRRKNLGNCKIPSCKDSAHARDLCSKHYGRAWRNANFQRKSFKWNGNKHLAQTWNNIQCRCNNPSDKKYEYYGGRGIRNLLTKEELVFLWERDQAAAMSNPSIDRKEAHKDYTLDNCQFIEHVENIKKGWISSPNRDTGMKKGQWKKIRGKYRKVAT